MTRTLAEGLRVKVDPKGWCLSRDPDRRSPEIIVSMGHCPVLIAFVTNSGGLYAWRTTWGLYGGESHHDITPEQIASLMGWQMPQQMQEAA